MKETTIKYLSGEYTEEEKEGLVREGVIALSIQFWFVLFNSFVSANWSRTSKGNIQRELMSHHGKGV